MMHIHQTASYARRGRALGLFLALVYWLTWPGVTLAQLDICGCSGHPESKGDFDAGNAMTYTSSGATRPAGSNTVTIPLPDDGVLIFSSFTVPSPITVRFTRNAANTPVTLLVSGDVTVGSTVGSNGTIHVNGDDGINGTAGLNGTGGLGGPGAFPGGDGAYPLVNFANLGGPGIGPGGGSGGTVTPLAAGSPGTFISTPQLLPLVGGAGGGGGASNSNDSSCSGGGGGGGGGALLIAANGTITVHVNGTISADGGNGASPASTSCASRGHGGSGGAIRLLANMIAGTGNLYARGGYLQCCFTARAGTGVILMEAFSNMSTMAADPVATRTPAPGPLANPLMPTVEITQVGGQTVPTPPQGITRGVDVVLPAPGPVTIRLATSGVPSGTTVNVTVKPRVGGAPIQQPTTLDAVNCTPAGDCDVSVVVHLPAGAHVIEAQATFQP